MNENIGIQFQIGFTVPKVLVGDAVEGVTFHKGVVTAGKQKQRKQSGDVSVVLNKAHSKYLFKS